MYIDNWLKIEIDRLILIKKKIERFRSKRFSDWRCFRNCVIIIIDVNLANLYYNYELKLLEENEESIFGFCELFLSCEFW